MNLPPEYLQRMQHLLGEEYEAFLACYAEAPVSGLRVNTLKISPDQFRETFPYPLSPVPWCPAGFTIPPGLQPGKHPCHAAGLYYLQDPSAMAVGELLAPRPGEKVLDLAAAPGGKTTHLAALMQDQGLLIANEIHPRRVWELAENLERCGVTNAAILNENPARLADHFGAFFDRVLLDAPCSGEGMFRRSETARQEWTPELVQRCAARQSHILHEAARLVRPGGWLAYATCTFSAEENEAVIARFIQGHPEFELEVAARFPGFGAGRAEWLEEETDRALPWQRAVRLWPHTGAAEGHFIAILRRAANSRQAGQGPPPRRQAARISAGAGAAFRIFWEEALLSPPPEEGLAIQGTYLYRVPQDLPGLAGLRVIHPGWWLGELKKGRFRPAHALALALREPQARQKVALSIEAAPAYLRGETLSSPGEPGWVLVMVRVDGGAFPLGWGRRVGEVVKNEYPKGLRWMG